jgi:ribosomal protein S18 acetylase RimI-like enzyme
MEFTIVNLGGNIQCGKQLMELLFGVYVGGGFTDSARGMSAFQVEEIRRHGDIFVAEADRELLGTVALNQPKDDLRQVAKDHETEIHLLAVKPSARKNGVAIALIRACEEQTLALGFRSIVLSTQPSMLAAHALYQRLGYKRNPNRDWVSENGKSYLVFEKLLNCK